MSQYLHYLDPVIPYLQKPEVLIGVGVFLILYSLYFLIKCTGRTIKLDSNEGGLVEITRSALNNLIYTTCARVGVEGKPSVSLKISRNKMFLKLKIKMNPNDRLSEISVRLQERLKQSFDEVLGYDRVGKVDVIVVGFRGAKRAKETTPAEHPEGKDPVLEDLFSRSGS